MPVEITWWTVAWRLTWTVVAGLVIGFNRGERGRPAGLRTTLLVCLAASLSMIEANLLMNSTGKGPDSFVVLDLMRLPLGVLSGMGFIGAGTILRRGNLVEGVTTAATLWYVTLMGLCFGGGQTGLGLAALVIGCGVLWGLKRMEAFIRREVHGELKMVILPGGPTDEQVRGQMERSGCKLLSWGVFYDREPEQKEIVCAVQWRPAGRDMLLPAAIESFRGEPRVAAVRWVPRGPEAVAGMAKTMEIAGIDGQLR